MHLQDELLFYSFDVCIYVYMYIHVFDVFYGGPHGRIADRLNVFIVNDNNC